MYCSNCDIRCPIYFPNCYKRFAVITRKFKKSVISDILKTLYMGVNMIPNLDKWLHVSHIFFSSIHWYVSFQELPNSVLWAPPPPLSIKLWSVKFTFICQNIKRDTLEVLEDETELYSKIKFCETYWLSTILFKNISVVLPYFELCAF